MPPTTNMRKGFSQIHQEETPWPWEQSVKIDLAAFHFRTPDLTSIFQGISLSQSSQFFCFKVWKTTPLSILDKLFSVTAAHQRSYYKSVDKTGLIHVLNTAVFSDSGCPSPPGNARCLPCMCACSAASVISSHALTLGDATDYGLPASSVHGIFPARILECVAIPSSRESSQPRDLTRISHLSCIAGRSFTAEPPGKPKISLFCTSFRRWGKRKIIFLSRVMCSKDTDDIWCGKLSEANLAIHTVRFVKLEADGVMCILPHNLTTQAK